MVSCNTGLIASACGTPGQHLGLVSRRRRCEFGGFGLPRASARRGRRADPEGHATGQPARLAPCNRAAWSWWAAGAGTSPLSRSPFHLGGRAGPPSPATRAGSHRARAALWRSRMSAHGPHTPAGRSRTARRVHYPPLPTGTYPLASSRSAPRNTERLVLRAGSTKLLDLKATPAKRCWAACPGVPDSASWARRKQPQSGVPGVQARQ